MPGSTILLNGTPLPTIFLGESAVTGDIVFNPGDVPRTATVTVETPGASASGAVVLEFFTSTIGAVLPSSRSVAVDSPATAFATLINAGGQTAKNCGLSAPSQPSLSVSFQTTDPTTNRPTGEPNALIDIPSGGSQSFIVSVRSTQPFAPRDVALAHRCSNNDQVSSGLDALLFSASATPVADIVALAATLSNDGIVDVAGPTGTGVFAVATVNVGASELITASADTGPVGLPIAITVCQTDPALGICLAPAAATATAQIDAGATPTFGIFVRGGATVPFDPARHRIYVRFRDPSGVTRGSTSVAVRTR